LSTTDLHTNLVNYDYYQDKPSQTVGLSKTAVLIKKARETNPNTVLVDSGDTIQGTPFGTYKALIDPELVIGRSEVQEINDTEIVIKSDENAAMKKSGSLDFVPNFVNPFKDGKYIAHSENSTTE